MKTLFPQQEWLVSHLQSVLGERNAAINTSETGTGKTLESVELVRRLGVAPLVICPKAVIPSWKAAFEEQGVPFHGIINYELIRRGKTHFGSGTKRSFQFAPDVPFVILDEAHRCQGTTSDNCRMAMAAKGIPSLLLSATLAEDPSNLKAAGYLLGLFPAFEFIKWARRYACSLDNWGKLQFTKSRYRAVQALTELNEVLYPSCGGRLTRMDLSEYFQQSHLITDPLDFGDNQGIEKEYSVISPYLEKLDEIEEADEVCPLTEMLRARQRVELMKAPVIAEMVKEARDEGFHCIVFVSFNDSVLALRKFFPDAGVIWGSDPETKRPQSSLERQNAIENFQKNHNPILLVNSEAGGVGLNLHDLHGNAPRMSFISPVWSAKSLTQILGRTDRAGAKTPSIQRVLVAADTIEVDVQAAVERKMRNMTQLLTQTNPAPTTMKTPAEPETAPLAAPAEETAALTTMPHAERAHARFNPSSLKYWEICPSYENQQSEENEFSLRGTRMHEACESEDPSKLHNDEEVEIVEATLNAVNNIIERHFPESKTPVKREKELRVVIKTTRHETFGTMDELITRGKIGVIIDYKFGDMPITDAEDNAQGFAYVKGVFDLYPHLEVIYVYFIQPSHDSITYGTFVRYEKDKAKYNANADLMEISLRIDLTIDRAVNLAGKEFHPNPHLCEFCGNRLTCKALHNKVLRVAAMAGVADGLSIPEHPDLNNPDDVADLYMLCRVLEKFMEDLKTRATELAFDQGYDIRGFVKRTRRVKRNLSDPMAAYHYMTKVKQFITEEEFFMCIPGVGIGKLEEFLGAKANRGEKTQYVEGVMAELRDVELLSGGDTEIKYLQIDRKQNAK